jgi:streptogramin lyase
VQEAELEIGSPDYLAELDGAVWVKLDGGDVVELDPATAKKVKSLDLDLDQDDLCQGLGVGGGYVWSCTASDVLRIDPATAKVVDTIPGVKIRDQGLMPFSEGRIWVLSGNADQLVGIDAATAKPGEPIALPVACTDVGPGAGSTLWVVCGLQNAVLQVDVDAATVVNRLELPSPTIAWGTETDLWVGDSDGLVRLDLERMQPVAVFDHLNPDLSGDLAVAGDDVWVRSAAGFLHHIDAATNTVVAHVEPPEAVSGGSVLTTDDAVWVTEFDDNVVLRLKPDA